MLYFKNVFYNFTRSIQGVHFGKGYKPQHQFCYPIPSCKGIRSWRTKASYVGSERFIAKTCKQAVTQTVIITCNMHQFFQWLLHRVHTQATHHKSCSQKYSCKKTLLSILTIIIVINIYIHSKKLGRLT